MRCVPRNILKTRRFPQHSPRALTLIEAMFLLVVLSIVAVAAGIGLQAVAKVPAYTNDIMSVDNVLVNVTEQTKASLVASWPSSTFSGALYIAGSSYTPSIAINNTAHDYGTPATYITVTSSLSINNKTYRLSMAVDQADPAGGTAYKSDYYRVIVAVIPYVNGSLATTGQQTMVTYVTQP
jgi:hypothetical protein